MKNPVVKFIRSFWFPLLLFITIDILLVLAMVYFNGPTMCKPCQEGVECSCQTELESIGFSGVAIRASAISLILTGAIYGIIRIIIFSVDRFKQ